MKDKIIDVLSIAAKELGFDETSIKLDYPDNPQHGDYSTNLALVHSRAQKLSPRDLAARIVEIFKSNMPDCVQTVEIAGPGFINFKLKDSAVAEHVLRLHLEHKNTEKILIEYTDPNTFKVFHIGHLMSNAIGESLSRLIEYTGRKVIRICYPSDIGLHIAKSVWALKKHLSEMPADDQPIASRTAFLGKMYVEGTEAYDSDPEAKKEIDELNGILYSNSDKEINELYLKGRQWSLEHFEQLYKRLGTNFDDQICESEMAPVGLAMAKDYLKKDILKLSDGAVVFKGEDFGLHTRVFINSHGLPTYEAKELGLNVTKFKRNPDTSKSIIVTASEQNDYFKVITKVLSLIDENIGAKTKHIGHGMLRFASGKMSSRTGKVITAESLITDLKEMVHEKIADRNFTEEEKDRISDEIAIGAIKYTILRSSIGSDIIFDSVASISFEGDSGPYLQYSAVRAASLIEKASVIKGKIVLPEKVGDLERFISRFDDLAMRAATEFAPQIIANYLVALAAAFNSFYASETIIDEKNPMSPYKVALVKSFLECMQKGLHLLGIKIPEKM